jgi:hypothetical protein
MSAKKPQVRQGRGGSLAFEWPGFFDLQHGGCADRYAL